ncbi:Uncharacterized protein OBRU01_15527 [Operophtera brumata]|uniref:Uncharacterized protein n=1 Tax=Operophtera brumata TaxID=104452 RepID=A0A0L7KUH3_OPEBR|nr:Uncharacterized protein OBRU01_15527 [Operophtera brumata]
MVNASLTYEILLYINSFYFGLFATCELGTLILKSVLISEKYKEDNTYPMRLGQDYVLLTLPSILGVIYLLNWQVVVLRIEYIWCTLMLCIQMLEFIFAGMFIVTMCKGPSYD